MSFFDLKRERSATVIRPRPQPSPLRRQKTFALLPPRILQRRFSEEQESSHNSSSARPALHKSKSHSRFKLPRNEDYIANIPLITKTNTESLGFILDEALLNQHRRSGWNILAESILDSRQEKFKNIISRVKEHGHTIRCERTPSHKSFSIIQQAETIDQTRRSSLRKLGTLKESLMALEAGQSKHRKTMDSIHREVTRLESPATSRIPRRQSVRLRQSSSSRRLTSSSEQWPKSKTFDRREEHRDSWSKREPKVFQMTTTSAMSFDKTLSSLCKSRKVHKYYRAAIEATKKRKLPAVGITDAIEWKLQTKLGPICPGLARNLQLKLRSAR